MDDKMIRTFRSARLVSVPIVVVQSADQPAAVALLKGATKDEEPVLTWDSMVGMQALNDAAVQAMLDTRILPAAPAKGELAAMAMSFDNAMDAARRLPAKSLLVCYNAQRQLTPGEPGFNPANVQGVANLRPLFEANHRMIVLLGPAFALPLELTADVVVLRHALPDQAALEAVVRNIVKATRKSNKDFPELDDHGVGRAVEALSGLSEFGAKQVSAMSVRAKGLDIPMVWEHKYTAIEQTRGLRVLRGTQTFKDIVGLDAVKAMLTQRRQGRLPVGVVVQLEEIDKTQAGVEHDTSGVRSDQVQMLLTEMEDNEYEGCLLAGFPGGGKTLLSSAFGNECGVPTIRMDLGAMEDKFVGESQQLIRQCMAVVKAIGGGRAFFIATSNNATVMRPEMQRRFTSGFFFFDLLTQPERQAAWQYFMAKYQLDPQAMPEDDGWTAAEIRNCARLAWNCNTTLVDAAKFILPVAKARAREFDLMRQAAHGRYLDASKPGPYLYDPKPMQQHVQATTLRGIGTLDMSGVAPGKTES